MDVCCAIVLCSIFNYVCFEKKKDLKIIIAKVGWYGFNFSFYSICEAKKKKKKEAPNKRLDMF